MLGPRRSVSVLWLAFLAIPATTMPAAPEPSIASERPDPATVQRFGPAYRYPRAGWIVVHIEGGPYDRGYQHGRLLAPEIADYVKTLAGKRSNSAPGDAWRETRTLVNALFLRRYDPEYLEEMKGIADGAAAAGATFQGRPLDLLDVVTVNSDIELEFLDTALDATATGLEGRSFRAPADLTPAPAPPEHCSAFAANGPATADGKIVFGHITMFSLTFVRHFNVWLDIKPETGHRVLMQTYPGGIQSGMDYYLNDAGLIVAETTIKQTRFDPTGHALASRIRKALQYSDSIDQAVATLKAGNNGMYTNEWLLADTKTNEIAMFELGTRKNRLWRSSKDEWFGGTKGFYWGCNNAKDVDVRLETVASLKGRPANVVYHPTDRDRAWLRLYDKHKGAISTAFGFEAFTTPPLAASPSLDAKFTTTEMARELKTWAVFGPPLGKTWEPSDAERRRYADVRPLVGNDWTILGAESPGETVTTERIRVASAGKPTERIAASSKAVDLPDASPQDDPSEPNDTNSPLTEAWHGTILPASDADIWLAAAFADFQPIVARERDYRARAARKKRDLTRDEQDAIDLALFAPYSHYRTAVARLGKDIPLAEIHPELTSDDWYQIASGKGVMLLSALRARLGDERFCKMMDAFGREYAGQPVRSVDFNKAAALQLGENLSDFFREWSQGEGLPGGSHGHEWSVDSFESDLDRTVIVYGTLKESDAQREAAGRLQRQIETKWSNITVPILSDREAKPESLKGRHILLVGRPDTNSLASTFAHVLPLTFGPASFVVRGETYAHAGSAVIAAGPKPDDPRSEVVIFAGLSAEATWKCVKAIGDRGEGGAAEVILLPAGKKPRKLVVSEPKENARTTAAH